ncbi:hypothetical protein PanWU01x14_192420 [Parasponia andersonii]|uniref:Uncharacterized protein n=1 Tax=Parasponia andersonii TaxID=3476 RepID=A0A2P5C1I3_PARAD|nr:hypothetical protein PanWU01x14_192420 [Parasponia andersonii]
MAESGSTKIRAMISRLVLVVLFIIQIRVQANYNSPSLSLPLSQPLPPTSSNGIQDIFSHDPKHMYPKFRKSPSLTHEACILDCITKDCLKVSKIPHHLDIWTLCI